MHIAEKLLTFHRFEKNNQPRITTNTKNEVVLEWNEKEICMESVINYMEDYGYITPDCFE